MEAKGPAFSISDLQGGSKRLNTVSESKSAKSSVPAELDPQLVESYENLYNKYNGDLDLIFEELNENPVKAKKPHNRPKNASEFAEKYLRGFYSVIATSSDAADEKSSHK